VFGERRTILVVDDDADVRSAVIEFLENTGFATLEAENGLEAWQTLDSGQRPVAGVLDMAMPGMNGSGLLKPIAADARFDDLPVIILSGDHNAREPRAAVTLRKPFDPDDLVGAIRAQSAH